MTGDDRGDFPGGDGRGRPDTSITLTGGEPTIREDLPEIVRLGAADRLQRHRGEYQRRGYRL
jgi:hypothetical protein